MTVRFRAKLFRWTGAGGWFFVQVPKRHAPPATHAWGRTPVEAIVDGHAWKTSVWKGKGGRTLLAIPKVARKTKDDGDTVSVEFAFNPASW